VQGSETAHESRQDGVNFLASNTTLRLFLQPEADGCLSTVWDLETVRCDVTKQWTGSVGSRGLSRLHKNSHRSYSQLILSVGKYSTRTGETMCKGTETRMPKHMEYDMKSKT
jgi:hypothetical protein